MIRAAQNSLMAATGCSALEVKQLYERTQRFAQLLAKLTSLYSAEAYDLSWRLKGELDKLPPEPEGRFERFRYHQAKTRLLRPFTPEIRLMWSTAVDANLVEQELFYALDVYDLGLDPVSYITTLLEALHAAGRLSNPQAVRDGREIYNNLAFSAELLRTFALEPAPQDQIDCVPYQTYRRARQ